MTQQLGGPETSGVLQPPITPGGPSSTPWATPPDEVLGALASARAGLSTVEVTRRLGRHGRNRLPDAPPRSPWKLFAAQVGGFLNLVLLAATALAWIVGDLKDATIIAVVVVFNTLLGFAQEYRAERALSALKRLVAPRARVRREGQAREVPADSLVPGDVVLLEAGDRVPADGRVLWEESLELDESALTGESLAAAKQAASVVDRAALAERASMVHMNTVVTRGRGEAAVTATGRATEVGRIARLLEGVEQVPTPLQVQLDHLAKRLAMIAAVAVAIIAGLELWRGDSVTQMLMEAIALAVAAVPEGLPAVVTVTLALGMQRMARHRAIVKRMAAVETLGATTVICSDKTGTLTVNEMTARAFWFRDMQFAVSGEGYRPDGRIQHASGPADLRAVLPSLEELLLPLALCNDSRVKDGALLGDPTEGALLVLAQKGGLDVDEARTRLPRVAEVPFEAERKLMATFHRDGADILVCVKGAPEVLVPRCSRILGTGARALDEAARHRVLQENGALAARGLRVLAVASHRIRASAFDPVGDLVAQLEGLCLVGLVGLVDPPRPEAREAIAQCRTAGIAVKMITGDQAGTATAIAADLGLHGEVLTGAQLEAMTDAALAQRIDAISVFARVAPEHKVRIVRALQARGHIVAMTGDGVNDAPALKQADMGVAMGAGTEVAKEAATMVLTDDNFATIVRAVREGRSIYANIVRFVRFQLSTNMGALLTVFFAPILGLPAPLRPVQILWVAMIMDGPPAVALGLDRARESAMREPPRPPSARILPWTRVASLLTYGALMAAGTLGVLAYEARTGTADRAVTLAFTTFVLFQLLNALAVRADGRSVVTRETLTNRWLWLALGTVLVLQVLAVHWAPLQGVFGTTALSVGEWALAAAVAGSILVLREIAVVLGLLRSSPRSPA